MTYDLTRRQFAAISLATALVTLPGRGWAKAEDYSNPHLLMEPEQLMDLVSETQSAAPANETAGLVVVDVRPREEFDAGHVPGARHLDPNAVVARFSPINGALRSLSDLENLLSELGIAADRQIVFYDDRGGFHAARMLWLMEYLGHMNVSLLNGGWSAWDAANGPVAKDERAYEPAVFQAALSPRRHASAEDVLAHAREPDSVLIDVRPTKMYDEGHIPWAVNIPWSKNLAEDGRFLDAESLRAHFASFGVKPESNVIMHCQIGLASAHSYVALRLLGFPRVRVYHRSWAEWSKDPSLPKSTS